MSKRKLNQGNLSQSNQPNASQQNENEENSSKLEDYVNKLVRYILFRAGTNPNFTRQEILKNVLASSGKHFNKIIDKANKVLETVYGYHIELAESSTSSKLYTVSNILPYNKHLDDKETCSKMPILDVLILSHIFMLNDSCSERAMEDFLRSLKIDFNKQHKLFGDVNEYVNKTMVKKKLLFIETDNHDNKLYKWGPRANVSIDRMQILNFVAKLHNHNPSHWTKQFEIAQQHKDE